MVMYSLKALMSKSSGAGNSHVPKRSCQVLPFISKMRVATRYCKRGENLHSPNFEFDILFSLLFLLPTVTANLSLHQMCKVCVRRIKYHM